MNKKRKEKIYELVQWCKNKGYSKEETYERIKNNYSDLKDNDFLIMWASSSEYYNRIIKNDSIGKMKIILFAAFIVTVIVLSGTIYFINRPEYIEYDNGIVVSFDVPIQKNTQSEPFIVEKDGKKYEITPLKDYVLSGVVLSKKGYSDYGSKLAPYDFAFAWGELINPENRKGVDFWQSNRWYYFRTDSSQQDVKFIDDRSANVHLVPKNENILKAMKSTPKYKEVTYIGKLISIKGIDDNFSWSSSLSRTDTGDGACELMYVEKIIIDDKLYE